MPILAQQLVDLHPDVIVSITTPATAAVKATTGNRVAGVIDGTQNSPHPGVDFIPATCSPPYPIGLHGEGVAFKRAANALHRARIDLEHDLRHPLLQGSGPDANLESGGWS